MKKLVFFICVLSSLTACGNPLATEPQPVPVVPNPITNLSGIIRSWTKGASTLEINGVLPSRAVDVIGKGSIAADGTVSGPLPTATQVQKFLVTPVEAYTSGDSCTNTFQASTNAKIARVQYFAVSINGEAVGEVIPGGVITGYGATVQQNYQTLIYADQAVNISGQKKCFSNVGAKGYTSTQTVDLTLAAGWNVVNAVGIGSQDAFSGQDTSTDTLAANWLNP